MGRLQVPVAVAAPAVDLGVIDELHVRLLTIDVWRKRVGLRVAFSRPDWFDHEGEWPRGRWTVTDAEGSQSSGRIGSIGGSGDRGTGEVLVDRPSPEALPWTVDLHRSGTAARATVGELRRIHPVTATVHRDVLHSGEPHAGTCQTCGAASADKAFCGACLGASRSAPSWLHAPASYGPLTPRSRAIGLDTGVGGIGCFLSLERWPGWWVLRHHIAVDWVAPWLGLRGRWRASVDGGDPVDGAMLARQAGVYGVTSEITFPGTLDPAASDLVLSLVRGDDLLAEVALPISGDGRR